MKKKQTLLRNIVRLYGITITQIAEELEVSQPTVDEFMKRPMYMRGTHRQKLAKMLQVTIDQMDDIVNGKSEGLADLLKRTIK
jgi:plasmid maintenance system antidote protein VapI